MAIHQYIHKDAPLAVELLKHAIYFHKYNEQKSFKLEDIDSISVAYWGDENIQYQTNTEASLIELLKVEIGTACLLLKLKQNNRLDFIELSNSNACVVLLKSIIDQHPKLWKGIAPYATICKVIQIKEEWTFETLSKKLILYLLALYLIMCLLVGFKYAVEWLF